MPDCIVVGGGVIGLLTARQLFLEGVDVLLIEKGKLGGESSWAGGGIISPLYPWRYDDSVNVLAERSKKIYPELIKKLTEESGQDCELITSGLFTVTDSQQEIGDWAKKWSVDAKFIDDRDSIRAIEDKVGDVVNQGEIVIKNNKVCGVRTQQETIFADKVIIASGAWSAKFSATESVVDVIPVKGQMIMYKGEPDLVKRIVLSEGHYIIPRKDGRILAGSTLEKIGYDKTISTDALAELHQAAIELIPLLADLTVERQWAGLRPGTKKGIPYICQHDAVENLYVHAGHFRNGIVLGAASAEMMTDIVLGHDARYDIKPYQIGMQH